MTIEAYPLQWPVGWRRSKDRTDARFSIGGTKGSIRARSVEVVDGVRRVYRELMAMGVQEADIVISSMLRPRLGGEPGTDSRGLSDPGVAVYWNTGGVARCMAIDRYLRVADNLAAVAATLEAMRAIDRHGGAEILDRAFSGFTALAAPEQPWQVLGVDMNATAAQIKHAYRRLASQHHPDKIEINEADGVMLGGGAEMSRINVAYGQMMKKFGFPKARIG